MRFLIVPFFVFAVSFAILQFYKPLKLNKAERWKGIGREVFISISAAIVTAIILFVVIVFFN